MRQTLRLLQHRALVTLFTRQNCSLCDNAKSVISNVTKKKKAFDYQQVDVMASDQQQWKLLYEFDTPVLHVQRVFYTNSKSRVAPEARKLMHRFDEIQVEELIDEIEQDS